MGGAQQFVRPAWARWLRLLALFVLPGAVWGLLPLWNSVLPAGLGIFAPAAFDGEILVSGLPAGTPTPFQPLANTPTAPAATAIPIVVIVPEGLETAAGKTAASEPAREPSARAAADPYRWHGLDLRGAGGPLRLVIAPPETVNWGRPVETVFQVGYPCEYADHRACLSVHQDGRLLLATVHSGMGGEGQMLRHALEGTGFNRAGYGLEQIAANVAGLAGSPVSAEQGGIAVDNLRVVAAGRVPASAVQAYFTRPFDEALGLAGIRIDEELARARAGESALLVIETCGWRHPDEGWAPGVSDTTGSIYLVVLGE